MNEVGSRFSKILNFILRVIINRKDKFIIMMPLYLEKYMKIGALYTKLSRACLEPVLKVDIRGNFVVKTRLRSSRTQKYAAVLDFVFPKTSSLISTFKTGSKIGKILYFNIRTL
jgi:hypothetical protein